MEEEQNQTGGIIMSLEVVGVMIDQLDELRLCTRAGRLGLCWNPRDQAGGV